MEDGFYVIGFRKVTNKYFVSLSLLPFTSHFPNFPVASLLSFLSIIYICSLSCQLLFVLTFLWSATTVLLLFFFYSPHFSLIVLLGLLPCPLSSPITPTGPAWLPAAGHGVSLPVAALDLWRPPMSTRQALAPKWWWSRDNSCPSPAHHRDLLTSYQDR